jgi:hypothetical protein
MSGIKKAVTDCAMTVSGKTMLGVNSFFRVSLEWI